MIISYIEDMGPSLYDPDESDLPVIKLAGLRINWTQVIIVDVAPPEDAPRKWWVNGNYWGYDERRIRVDGYGTNFLITIEKTNQFGTKREEIPLFIPRVGPSGNDGGSVGVDARVEKIMSLNELP